MTPRQVLRDLCGTTETGQSRKDIARRKDFVCKVEFISTSRSPERNHLTDFGSPPIPTRAFCIKKGDFFPILLCSSESSKNLAVSETLSMLRRTSLVGLALDSTTSSGLGRAPALQCRTPSRHHLELQDMRDYTPADRATRTCWVREARVYQRQETPRENEKITRAPRERETRTHLKKVSPLRGASIWKVW
ncbi:hypothetical protein TNCV_3513591 [Trichonephila clavipes]|nr:hypothetical protein TNCV_3513591 [Trichonephila clavipes]